MVETPFLDLELMQLDGPGKLYVYEQFDSHGGDMTEWPEDLRVRQFPQTVVCDV